MYFDFPYFHLAQFFNWEFFSNAWPVFASAWDWIAAHFHFWMGWSWHWFTSLSMADWETTKEMYHSIWMNHFAIHHGWLKLWDFCWGFIFSLFGTIGIFVWWYMIHFVWPLCVAIVTFLVAVVLAVLWFLALVVWLVVWKTIFCMLFTTVWNIVAWFLIDFLWAGAVWLWPYILIVAKLVIITILIPAFASELLELTKKKNELFYVYSWMGWTTLLVVTMPTWLAITMLISTVLYYNSEDLQRL